MKKTVVAFPADARRELEKEKVAKRRKRRLVRKRK